MGERIDTRRNRFGLGKLSSAVYAVLGILYGLLVMEMAEKFIDGKGGGSGALAVLIFLGALLVSLFLHTLLHEFGKYLSGRLSGWSFVSFRMGGLKLSRVDGKLKAERASDKRRGGQCVMLPPDGDGINYKCFPVLFGGGVLNIIFGAACLVCVLFLPELSYLRAVLIPLGVTGIFYALVKWVPIASAEPNEGRYAASILKIKGAKKAYWTQQRVQGLLSMDGRLKDVPEERFALPDGADRGDALICTVVYLGFCRLIDMHDFARAASRAQELLTVYPGLTDEQKNEVRCERLFCELMLECRDDAVRVMYTPELKNYMNKTGAYMQHLRTMYAYDLIYRNNKTSAKKELKDFNKVADKHPCRGEAKSERELVALVARRAEERERQDK